VARNALWVIAVLLPLVWLAVISYLLRDRVQVGKVALGDLVNVATLAVAAVSLVIAIAAYQDATRSGAEQQKTLDASRGALEAVVERATNQQKLLERAAGTLDTQLSLLQEQTTRELERLGRRPQVEIALGQVPWKVLQTAPAVPVLFGQLWQTFDFTVKNTGTAPAVRPTVLISAQPPTVFVDQAGLRMAERPNHSTYQFSGPTVQDVLPFSQVNTSYQYSVDVTVPQGVGEFDLQFRIFAENLPAVTASLHVVVRRPGEVAAPK